MWRKLFLTGSNVDIRFCLIVKSAQCSESFKLPTSSGSLKRQQSSRKTFVLLTTPKPLTVWITTNCGRFWEMGISDHLTYLLRNLYAGQEAIVGTGHGTTDWFQIGKGVRQSCILSPCLFNVYAEYIMRNAGVEEAQAAFLFFTFWLRWVFAAACGPSLLWRAGAAL